MVTPKLETLSPLMTTEGFSVSFAKNDFNSLGKASKVTAVAPI